MFEVIERDLRVSGDSTMDLDWRFVAAYNAALQAATIALHASGYEAAKGGGAHYYTIESLKHTIAVGDDVVNALQAFKAKRGGSVYEATGIASTTEVEELRDLANELCNRVRQWLTTSQPSLLRMTKA